jgi:DNA-binding CsgD family transcriptional regulator
MEIIGRIYEALDNDEALETLPEAIAKEIGSRSCTLQLMTPDFELEGSWVTHFNGEMYDFYKEHDLHLFDAWTNTNMNVFGTDRTERHTDFLPLEEFRNSFYYNEFIRRFGDDSAYCLGFISTRPDGGYLVAGLQKGITDQNFTDEQVTRFEELRPHLTKLMVLRRNLMVREVTAAGALIGIDSIEDAYLILRNDRRIIFANASAEALLKEGSLLRSVSGELHLKDDRADSNLTLSVRDASTNETIGKTSFVVRDRDGTSWRFTLAPKTFDGETMTLVWIDRCQSATSAQETMQQIYGLTPAELPILMAVSQGLSAGEISDQHGISIATVRSHIQHIYQKTGVNKATQLAQLVASLPRVR